MKPPRLVKSGSDIWTELDATIRLAGGGQQGGWRRAHGEVVAHWFPELEKMLGTGIPMSVCLRKPLFNTSMRVTTAPRCGICAQTFLGKGRT